MAKEVYAAVLRLVKPEVNKGFEISYTLPNSNKPTRFVWNKDNGFETEIPTKITYVDDHKKTVVFKENYALEILHSYGVKHAKKESLKLLEFVKELSRDVYDASPFEAQRVSEQPKVDGETDSKESKKKENKNEK